MAPAVLSIPVTKNKITYKIFQKDQITNIRNTHLPEIPHHHEESE
jgi:hypothetical protein